MSLPCRFLSVALFAVLTAACDDDAKPNGGGDDTAAGEGLPQCPGTWNEHDDGVWLQPSACLAWSPVASSAMDWYAAASPEDATAGGCAVHCDDQPGYCADLDTGGIGSWRLPSMDELQDAGFAEPPMEDLVGYLWSRDSSDAAESMAYQNELATPESVFMAGKDQEGLVRCVADL